MHTTHRLARLLLALHLIFTILLLLAPKVSARPMTAIGFAQAEDQAPIKLYLWTGRAKGGGPPSKISPAFPSSDEVEKILTSIQVGLEVDRDFHAARIETEDLWLRVNLASGSPQGEAATFQSIAKVAAFRADLFRQMGHLEQALVKTNLLALRPSKSIFNGVMEFTPASNRHLETLVALRSSHPALTDLRALIQQELADQQQAASAFGLPEDRLAYLKEHFGLPSRNMHEHVMERISDARVTQIADELGIVAAPSLALVVLSDLNGESIDPRLDPLTILLQLDETGGCQLMHDYLEEEGGQWRHRVFRVFRGSVSFRNDQAWHVDASGRRPVFLKSYWIPLLADLARDPMDFPKVRDWILRLAERDNLTPELQDVLKTHAAQGSQSLALSVVELASHRRQIPSGFPVLEAAMSNADEVVRTAASTALICFPESAALRAAFHDPSPFVRANLAASLTERPVLYPIYKSSGQISNEYRTLTGPHDEGARQLLVQLLSDEDEQVRDQAAAAILKGDWVLEDLESYLKLVDFANPEQAAGLARLAHPDRKLHSQLLEALASHPDSEVRLELDRFLWTNADWTRDVDVLLPAFRRRYTDEQVRFAPPDPRRPARRPHETRREVLDFVFEEVCRTPKGLLATLSLAFDQGDSELLRAFSHSDFPDHAAIFAELQAEELELFLRGFTSAEGRDNGYAVLEVMRAIRDKADFSVDRLQDIASDQDTPQDARLAAMAALANRGPKGAERFLLATLADCPEPPQNPSSPALFRLVSSIRFQDDSRQLAFIETALGNQAVHSAWRRLLLGSCPMEDDGPRTLAVLEQAFMPWALGPVESHWHKSWLSAAAQRVVQQDMTGSLVESLSAAMQYHFIAYVEALAPPIGIARHKEFIPVLGEILRANRSSGTKFVVIPALAAFLNEDAARELAEGLGSVSIGEERKRIQEALATIRNYQEEVTYWASGRSATPERGEAIKELLGMLEDEDPAVRAAAVRALGSFDIPEFLPRIIKMLKDEDETVRRSAQETLQRFGG